MTRSPPDLALAVQPPSHPVGGWCRFALVALIACVTGLVSCVREEQLLSLAGGAGGQAGQLGTSGTAGSFAGAAGHSGATVASSGGKGGAAGGGSAGGGAANAGSAGSGAPSVPWLEATCIQALSAGKTGDPCKGPFKCSASQGCCAFVASCSTDTIAIDQSCSGCVTACTADSDCMSGELCENYQCRACPPLGCPPNWSALDRHGCVVCVPPSLCKGDLECSKGLTCHAGLSCLPGCKGDPACCFGNFCASPACGAPLGLDCALVGCIEGQFCKAGSDPVNDCVCDESKGAWSCPTAPLNQCVSL